jgi:hypothetical protein
MRPTQNGQPVLGFWVPGCWRSGGSTSPPRVDFVGSKGSLRELWELGKLQPADGIEIKLSIFVRPDSWWIVLALLHYLPSGACKLDDVSLVRLLRPFFTDRALSIFTCLAVVALLFSYGYPYLSRPSSSIHRHSSINLLHKVGVLAFWKGGKKARSKTMELGRGTHDKGERGARSGLRMPKNKNKKCSAVFRLQRVSE